MPSLNSEKRAAYDIDNILRVMSLKNLSVGKPVDVKVVPEK